MLKLMVGKFQPAPRPFALLSFPYIPDLKHKKHTHTKDTGIFHCEKINLSISSKSVLKVKSSVVYLIFDSW